MNLSTNDFQAKGFKIVPLFNNETLDFLREYISQKIYKTTKYPFPLKNSLPDGLHQLIRDKHARLLCSKAIETLKHLGLFNTLEIILGKPYEVTDEERLGRPEIYWRYVRPNSTTDVGPLHADGWFWDLNQNWKMPPDTDKRLKVWAPIQAEEGLSGLKVIPGSHKRHNEFKFDSQKIGGKYKPQILLSDFEAELLTFPPGEAIIFDDLLIHGGAVTKGNLPRISIEFTLAYSQ